MNNSLMPCGLEDDRMRFEPDGPELERPVWIKTDDCKSAVELSAKVSVDGLCRMWAAWRDSGQLVWLLHGFLMITSLRNCDAAWLEIQFLHDLIETEAGL